MRIARRSAVIAVKAAKLASLVLMIRCLGPEGTQCLLASAGLARRRLIALIASLLRRAGRGAGWLGESWR